MFCKWCGADIPTTTTKCDRCGKENPARSDCGGFFNIAPGSLKPAGESPLKSTMGARPADRPTEPVSAPVEQTRKSGGTGLLLLCFIGLVVAAVLIITMSRKNDKPGNEMESTETSETGSIVEPGDETQPQKEAKLVEQHIRIDVLVTREADDISVTTTASLGEAKGSVTDQVILDDNKKMATLWLELDGSEKSISLKIDRNAKKRTVSLQTEVDSQLFGEEQDAEYLWECRKDSTEEWKPVDAKQLSAEDTTATYKKGAEIEYRVTYTRNNKDGGSLTLTITGIGK